MTSAMPSKDASVHRLKLEDRGVAFEHRRQNTPSRAVASDRIRGNGPQTCGVRRCRRIEREVGMRVGTTSATRTAGRRATSISMRSRATRRQRLSQSGRKARSSARRRHGARKADHERPALARMRPTSFRSRSRFLLFSTGTLAKGPAARRAEADATARDNAMRPWGGDATDGIRRGNGSRRDAPRDPSPIARQCEHGCPEHAATASRADRRTVRIESPSVQRPAHVGPRFPRDSINARDDGSADSGQRRRAEALVERARQSGSANPNARGTSWCRARRRPDASPASDNPPWRSVSPARERRAGSRVANSKPARLSTARQMIEPRAFAERVRAQVSTRARRARQLARPVRCPDLIVDDAELVPLARRSRRIVSRKLLPRSPRPSSCGTRWRAPARRDPPLAFELACAVDRQRRRGASSAYGRCRAVPSNT